MAVTTLYKKVLDENAEKGTSIKTCTAEKFQIDAMKKIGWCKTEAEAKKVTKASLEKAAGIEPPVPGAV